MTAGTSPLRMCRSVPQMVTASTRTIGVGVVDDRRVGTSSQDLSAQDRDRRALSWRLPSFRPRMGGELIMPRGGVGA